MNVNLNVDLNINLDVNFGINFGVDFEIKFSVKFSIKGSEYFRILLCGNGRMSRKNIDRRTFSMCGINGERRIIRFMVGLRVVNHILIIKLMRGYASIVRLI